MESTLPKLSRCPVFEVFKKITVTVDDTKWSFLLSFYNINFCGPEKKFRIAPTKNSLSGTEQAKNGPSFSLNVRGYQREAEAMLGQRLWGANEWAPCPPRSWPVLGEEGGPSGPPRQAEHLWDFQRLLLGTLDRGVGGMCVDYENACHIRSTWLPFLKNKTKQTKQKGLHASFLIRPERPDVKPQRLPPAGQAGLPTHPHDNRGLAASESCLSVWPAKEENKTEKLPGAGSST